MQQRVASSFSAQTLGGLAARLVLWLGHGVRPSDAARNAKSRVPG